MGNGGLTGLADTGYCAGEQLKACEGTGMDVYAPMPERAVQRLGLFELMAFGGCLSGNQEKLDKPTKCCLTSPTKHAFCATTVGSGPFGPFRD